MKGWKDVRAAGRCVTVAMVLALGGCMQSSPQEPVFVEVPEDEGASPAHESGRVPTADLPETQPER